MKISQEGKKLRELIEKTGNELAAAGSKRQFLCAELAAQKQAEMTLQSQLDDLRACLYAPDAKPAEAPAKKTRKPRKTMIVTTPETTEDAPPAEKMYECDLEHRSTKPVWENVKGKLSARCPTCEGLMEEVKP